MNIGIWGWTGGRATSDHHQQRTRGWADAGIQCNAAWASWSKVVDIGLGDGDVVALLQAAMTPRTRLISLSHVSWMSGARLPLEAITAMAHRQGALVLVDGAQSVGAIPLDAQCAGSGHVHGDRAEVAVRTGGRGEHSMFAAAQEQVQPTYAGYASIYPDMGVRLPGQLPPERKRQPLRTGEPVRARLIWPCWPGYAGWTKT